MHLHSHVSIRVDASRIIGTGHLRRCLSLAHALIDMGARVDLLVRRLDDVAPQILSELVLDSSLRVHWLPFPIRPFIPEAEAPTHQAWAGVKWDRDALETVALLRNTPPNWMVVDHYAFDARWHSAVRQELGCRLLAVDDLADRPLDVDVLLDQNWDADHHAKYDGFVQREPRWLTGPHYALLSKTYISAPRYRFHEQVRSLGVFMGGVDSGGASLHVLQICRSSGFDGPVEIVSTSSNPYLANLREICATMSATTLTLDEPNLAAFFARHDLLIGAGGGATWERCCIGTPTICLVLAENQMAVVPALHEIGALQAARLDGKSEPADLGALSQVLSKLLAEPNIRHNLSTRAALLVDGRGAQRVALSIMSGHLRLRPASFNDSLMLYQWRNHPVTREVSKSKAPIDMANHIDWLRAVLSTNNQWLFVAEVGQLAVGCIRFDQVDVGHLEVSIYLDPDLRGLGLGQSLLSQGTQEMLALYNQSFTINAIVMPDNIASKKLFEACGYHGGPTRYQKIVVV